MTAAAANKIFRHNHPFGRTHRHPLEGKTVREWVQEARAGWPRVPVPRDPEKAAQKVMEKYAESTWLIRGDEYDEE